MAEQASQRKQRAQLKQVGDDNLVTKIINASGAEERLVTVDFLLTHIAFDNLKARRNVKIIDEQQEGIRL